MAERLRVAHGTIPPCECGRHRAGRTLIPTAAGASRDGRSEIEEQRGHKARSRKSRRCPRRQRVALAARPPLYRASLLVLSGLAALAPCDAADEPDEAGA